MILRKKMCDFIADCVNRKHLIDTEYHLLVTDETKYKKFVESISKNVKICHSSKKYSEKLIGQLDKTTVETLIKLIGLESFKHLIFNYVIIRVDQNGVQTIVSGDINLLNEHNKKYLNRKNLLLKNKSNYISKVYMLNQILNYGNENVFREIAVTHNCKIVLDRLDNKIENVLYQYGKLPINSIIESKIKTSLVPDKLLIDFLFCISKKVLKGIFTYEQFKVLKGKLTLFIIRNAREHISANEITNYITWTKCKLFSDIKMSKVENKICFEIFKNLMLTIFDEIFIRIIQHHFFVSVESKKGYKLTYHKRKDWEETASNEVKNFLNTCETVEPSEKYNTIKAVAKNDEYRIITNCKQTNWFYRPVVALLRSFIKNKSSNEMFGFRDINLRLKEMLKTKENFYCCVFDIKTCFDQIDIDKMAYFIENLLNEEFVAENYALCKYKKLQSIKNTIIFKEYYLKNDIPLRDDNENVIYKFIKRMVLSKEDLRNILISGIKNNVVKHENTFYKITQGILQGLPISTYLCALYLYYMKKECFGFIKKGQICNYVDDFLCITPCKEEFNQITHLINDVKFADTIVNLKKVQCNGKPNDFVIWCGYKIYSNGFNIKYRYQKEYFNYYFVLSHKNPGKDIEEKVMRIIDLKLGSILFDKANNKIYENLFDLFMYALRIITLLFKRTPFVNMSYVKKLIRNIIVKIKAKCKINIPEHIISNIVMDCMEETKVCSEETYSCKFSPRDRNE